MKVKSLDENIILDDCGNFVDSKYYNIYYHISYLPANDSVWFYEISKRKRIFPSEKCRPVGKIDIDIDGEKSSKILMSAYKIIQRYDINDAKSHIDELLEETEDANEIYIDNPFAIEPKESIEIVVDILKSKLGDKLKETNYERFI